MIARLILTPTLNEFVANLEDNGCTVEWDKEAGTVKVTDEDEKCVLAAIQKGHNQPWIARFTESDRIKWDV